MSKKKNQKKEKVAKKPEKCPQDVVAMAEKIRRDHHKELAQATIVYIFEPKGTVK